MLSAAEAINWDYLKFFVSLAEQGSLNGAARVLGTSHTTVGRNIALFEQKIGVRLFDRIGNRYFLNSEGRRIFNLAREIRDRIQTIGELLDLGSPHQRQKFRVATTAFVSDHLFPEILESFLDGDFSLSIDTVLGQDMSSSIDETYTLAISQHRIGRANWSSHRLGALDVGFFCTRGYRDSTPITLNERHLRSHRFALWADVQRAQHAPAATSLIRAVAAAATVVSDSLHVVVQTVLQGRAVGTLPKFIARRHADLQPVLQDTALDGLTVWSHVNLQLERSSQAQRVNAMIAEALRVLPQDDLPPGGPAPQSSITIPS